MDGLPYGVIPGGTRALIAQVLIALISLLIGVYFVANVGWIIWILATILNIGVMFNEWGPTDPNAVGAYIVMWIFALIVMVIVSAVSAAILGMFILPW